MLLGYTFSCTILDPLLLWSDFRVELATSSTLLQMHFYQWTWWWHSWWHLYSTTLSQVASKNEVYIFGPMLKKPPRIFQIIPCLIRLPGVFIGQNVWGHDFCRDREIICRSCWTKRLASKDCSQTIGWNMKARSSKYTNYTLSSFRVMHSQRLCFWFWKWLTLHNNFSCSVESSFSI